ncbi:MAG: M23 family metallopeptidase [Alphaproteobacteria bacterium]|nr:M23 family metallopeptidase [Alphaproteobacteria bacterium]MBV9694274.1 M23 family metallopeptidase [Alphaproteobacteria bacterium]
MSETANLERARRIGLMVLAALALGACAETPRTELSWGVREHKSRPHQTVAQAVAGNTFYGPRAVSLPPVRQGTLPPVDNAAPREQQADNAKPKPKRMPAWYTPAPTANAPYTADEPSRTAEGPVRFAWPLSGRVVSEFGPDQSGERNDGINIAAPAGTPVHAAAAGVVKYCGNELRGYGNLVLIEHDGGYITAYAHVDNIVVNRADRVAAGQVIATSGASGDVAFPQLHFEIRRDKRPVDPKLLLPRGMDTRMARAQS